MLSISFLSSSSIIVVAYTDDGWRLLDEVGGRRVSSEGSEERKLLRKGLLLPMCGGDEFAIMLGFEVAFISRLGVWDSCGCLDVVTVSLVVAVGWNY